jgi:hypothetical protein
MSQACSAGSDGQATRWNAGTLWAATEMLCSAAHVSPLSGMVTMYLLMSAFHAAPWLKLIRTRRLV